MTSTSAGSTGLVHQGASGALVTARSKLDVKAEGPRAKHSATWSFLLAGTFAHDVDAYVAELHRQRGIIHPFQLFEGGGALLKSHYFPAFADDGVAADAYCWSAANNGTHRSKGRPMNFLDMLPQARAKALEPYLDPKADDSVAVAEIPEHHYTTLALESSIGHHIEIEVGAFIDIGGVVETVHAGGKGVAIRASQTGNVSREHDCVETNKVDSIDARGHVNYKEACEFAFSKSKVILDLQLVDAPADLKAGDWIDFDALVEKTEHGKNEAQTGAVKDFRFVLKGLLVRKVSRAKNHGDRIDQFQVLGTY